MASLEFDGDINDMYVRLREGRVSSTEPLADNIMVDFDKRNRVLGLELLLPPTVKEKVKAELVLVARRQSRPKPGRRSRSPTYPMFK